MECYRFAHFLENRSDLVSSVAYLDEILAFEHALLAASLSVRRPWCTGPSTPPN